MKLKHIKFLFIIGLSLLFSEAKGQDTLIRYYNIDWEECTKAQHKFYSVNYEVDSGYWAKYDYFKSGALQMVGRYKTKEAKVKHGLFVYFKENGDTTQLHDYVDGEIEGRFHEFHENGNPSIKTILQNNVQEGVTYYYHPNGKLSSTGMFHKGMRIGKWLYFDERGNNAGSEYFASEFTAPCGCNLTFPSGQWIHVNKETTGKVEKGISIDKFFKKNTYSKTEKELYLALELVCYQKWGLQSNADKVSVNFLKGQKWKYKKIKKYKDYNFKFSGSIYNYKYKSDDGRKLNGLLFAKQKGNDLLQLIVTFENGTLPDDFNEVVKLINSLDW